MSSRVEGMTAIDPERVLHWLPAAVVVLDRELFVSYANLAASTLGRRVGVTLKAGKTVADDSAETLRELVSTALHRGAVAESELPLGRGTVLVSGRVDHDQVVLQLEDVTERARHLRSAEDFVVNAAHEFLSPLTSIAGAAHALEEGAREQAELRDRFISHIAKAANRLIVISNALLVLARAEAGSEPPRLESVPLRPLLLEVLTASGVPAPAKTIRCADSTSVFADRDLLGVAFSTLVDNARRHSRDGSLAVRVAELGGSRISIEVVNPGYGIAQERLETVKGRFVSLGGGGFGIGLSIAARAVGAFGGTLSLAADDSATTARIVIPTGGLEST